MHNISLHIGIHNYIVFFYYCNASNLMIILLILIIHRISIAVLLVTLWLISMMVLLCLNNMSSQHLRIFDFYLRVVEYVIVIVYIFYYLYWLILTLFLRFRRSTSSLMGSMKTWVLVTISLTHMWLWLRACSTTWFCKVIRMRCIISRSTLMSLITSKMTVSMCLRLRRYLISIWLSYRLSCLISNTITSTLSFCLILRRLLLLFLFTFLFYFISITIFLWILLENYFSWLINIFI